MTDDLVKRWDEYAESSGVLSQLGMGKIIGQQMRDRIEVLTAERDRLRKELEDIANDYEAGYPLSHDTIKYAARAALKGETP